MRRGAVATPEIRAAAGTLWAFRAHAERDAAARFRRMTEGLDSSGALPVVIRMASDAAGDEDRHARLCAQAAARFDHPVRDVSSEEAPAMAPPTLGLRERVLYEVVAQCCITETLSAVYLRQMMGNTVGEPLHGMIQEVLKDEVSHSRLGWAHLASERDLGMDMSFLGPHLSDMLAGTVQEALFGPEPAEDPSLLLRPFGGLSHEERRDGFEGALAEVILPGLETHGVDVGAARDWLEARTSIRR